MKKPMTRPKLKHVRFKDDAYFSPRPLARAIAFRLRDAFAEEDSESCDAEFDAKYRTNIRHILEPSAGDGSFVEAAKSAWPHARITAIEPNRIGANSWHTTEHRTTFEAWCAKVERSKARDLAMPREVDLIIGNPPYMLAEEHVTLARKTGAWVAFLLRLSFLGSQARARTVWASPGLRWLIPISRRPSFTGGGSDASEYAVFVWQRGYEGNAEILSHLQWSEDE